MNLSHLLSFSIVVIIRCFSKLFYKTKVKWITPEDQIQWEKLRVLVMLNHTSLFEPLFVSSVSIYRLWRAVRRVVIPVADVTMSRPFVGFFFRLLLPVLPNQRGNRSFKLDKIPGSVYYAIPPAKGKYA